jgi:hypothetical protein
VKEQQYLNELEDTEEWQAEKRGQMTEETKDR